MIKEVIFDIDNTLYDYEIGHAIGMKRMTDYARETLGISEERFKTTYKRFYDEEIERLGRDNAAIHSRSIRLQKMLEYWKLPIFPHVRQMYDLYWNGLLEVSTPEPGSLEAVKTLSELGIKIGIGTDMTFRMQYEKLDRLGFAPYITHMVTSQEAGAEKPHPDFMALCVKKADCKPSDCVFVGDSFKKDVCGAAQAGMRAVWYNAKENPRPTYAAFRPGQYQEIHHFDELVPFIQSIQ